ncbi:hypothetical protein S7711_07868 [Stachybotrys chartarum IBT 7711]|uniref:Apple domain-containing protein n=1 Tax=Stachybotrys chartarum (strain CBS 109288 / IBT 7711) TaxID=1280523 RepID=A0A084AXQ5_STACB|nr:hypothetical protein S7711_07868 [Stachybotrys chartarum IBT 7711]
MLPAGLLASLGLLLAAVEAAPPRTWRVARNDATEAAPEDVTSSHIGGARGLADRGSHDGDKFKGPRHARDHVFAIDGANSTNATTVSQSSGVPRRNGTTVTLPLETLTRTLLVEGDASLPQLTSAGDCLLSGVVTSTTTRDVTVFVTMSSGYDEGDDATAATAAPALEKAVAAQNTTSSEGVAGALSGTGTSSSARASQASALSGQTRSGSGSNLMNPSRSVTPEFANTTTSALRIYTTPPAAPSPWLNTTQAAANTASVAFPWFNSTLSFTTISAMASSGSSISLSNATVSLAPSSRINATGAVTATATTTPVPFPLFNSTQPNATASLAPSPRQNSTRSVTTTSLAPFPLFNTTQSITPMTTSSPSAPTRVIDVSMTPVLSSPLLTTLSRSSRPTTTVTELDATGAPVQDRTYCGIRGQPAGTYFIAEFIEDRPGVQVTLEGCYQFCDVSKRLPSYTSIDSRGFTCTDLCPQSVMESTRGCQAYRFYHNDLGAPRCTLYGMPVPWVVRDLDERQEDQWWDLDCGSPTEQL